MNGTVNAPGVTSLELEAVKSSLQEHTSDRNNPHRVTKAQVGLGKVDNTADVNKPISIAQQAALDQKADAVHIQDTVKHITAEERNNWNAKANSNDFSVHASDTTAHITEAERAQWNAKANNSDFSAHANDTTAHITAAERAQWNAKANNSDFSAHESDTTAHITAAERAQWNAKANNSDFSAHANNTTVHITATERAQWNAKQGALSFDSTPTAGSSNPVTSNGVKAALDKKAPLSHGSHVQFAVSLPEMDGTAFLGSASTCARSDHVHPTDTSRAPATHKHSTSDITSGTLSSDRLPIISIPKGGTGATSASAALSNLGISIQSYVPAYLSDGTIALVYM